MASGTELAAAYVSIMPSTRGLGKSIANEFNKVQGQAATAGQKSGNSWAASFGKWAGRAVKVGAAAAGAVAGAAVVTGFKSAVDQQRGQAVLEGLYGDADKAASTLEKLKDVAAKSPIDYSAYQEAAGSLAYAGVEGDQAIGILGNVGKAITAAGGGSVELERATSGIMKAVNNGGIAMMDSLSMISESGVPILSGLAEKFGVGTDEIKKMASEGKISIEDVMDVMSKGTGDTFQKMMTAGDKVSKSFGSQWKIVKDNVTVALGEALLPLLEKITPMLAPIGDAVVDAIGKIPAVADKIREAFGWIQQNISWIKPLAFALGGVAAAIGLVAGALWVATAATTAWGFALRITPLGWIVTAIGAVVGVLIWFFTQTELGKKIWTVAWGGIKIAAAAVWNWIKNTLWPGIVAAWNGIAAAGLWLWRNVMVPVWNGIKVAANATAGWIVNKLVPWLVSAWNVIAGSAKWLYNKIIKPVWYGIRVAIAVVVSYVMLIVKGWIAFFKAVVAPVFKWLYNKVIKPVWNAIKVAIKVTVDWFKNTAWPILSKVIGWIRKKFDEFKIGLKIIWAFIRNKVIAPVVNWFRATAYPVFQKVLGWLRAKFEQFKIFLKLTWALIRNRIIGPVVNWFRGTVWPILSNIIDKIKGAFNGLKDRLKVVWNAIKNTIVKPVVDWFKNTVKPKIDDVTDGIKSAFDSMKSGVKKAWDAVKSNAKKPIKFVIETVLNDGIIKNFNSIAGTFGVKDIPDVKLPKGFATGGYTGKGAKYQPAGIVHADEYVIRKESQNDLRRNAPGFLDSLNRHGARALGYAKGGLVKLRMPFAGTYGRGEGFGARNGKHKGIDFPMPSGAVLKAVAAGVASRTSNAAAGNKLELSIGDGLVAGYHHLSGYIAKNGQSVGRGADVGYVGSTGRSSGPHLHFSLKKDGTYVDPAPYLGEGGAAGSGDGGGGFFNPFAGLWKSLKDKIRDKVGDTAYGDVLTEMPKKLISSAKDWVTDKLTALSDIGSDIVGGISTGVGAARYTPVATQALTMTGNFTAENLASLMRRMQQESNYNKNAINNWDSNAAKGTPSKGLMQVIQPTFDAYKYPGHDDIWKPLDNILASIRYTKAAYGSLQKGWNRAGGYAAGGWTGPGSKYTPAGVVHADEYVVQKSSRRSIERARPGFLDRLNRHGAAALGGYANGGLVGYASGGSVSPLSKIGNTKVSIILEGLTGTAKKVQTAAGQIADGIVKVFNDRMKDAKTATTNKLTDSLASLKKQASALNKTITATTAKSKKNTVNRLTDDLAKLRKQKSTLSATAREVKKVTKVTGKTKSGKLITKTVTQSTSAAKKAAKSLNAVNKQIESTQSALVKARRGDYSGAAKAATARLKSVQKQIAATEKALKAVRRGDVASAATLKGTKAYNAYVAKGIKQLEAYANKSDTLTAKLKAANAQLTEATKLKSEYATSMTEKFAESYGFSDESGTTGIETIIRGFKNAASTVTTFTKQLATLKSRGLSDPLIDQIAQLGAESGSKVAKNLLTGTDSQIKQITTQHNKLNTVSASSGTSLAKQMYQSGVNSAQGLVKGLTSQLAAVEKAAAKLATKVVKTVKSKLKIKSPSRVFAEIGKFTGEGMIVGIEAVTPSVQSAMSRLATPPEVYSGGVATSNGGTARGGVTINGGQFGYSPDEIGRGIVKAQKKQEALYVY